MAQQTVYGRVTEAIVRELEHGVAPWVKPWSGGGSTALPYNASSQRRYSGVNVLLLWEAALDRGYRNPAWITFNQAHGLGGHVKRGEHAIQIVYASTYQKRDDDADRDEDRARKVSFLKFYAVFNVEQTEGLPQHLYRIVEPPPVTDMLSAVDGFLARVGADVHHGGDRAFYRPLTDTIQLPEPGWFESIAHYYATSLHEHAHWTGHPSRLARDLSGRFGSEAYAAEELVAELSAAFLCAILGVPGQLRHAEYLGSWLSLLRSDNRAIFTASSKATEAAQFLERAGGIAAHAEEEVSEAA